MTDRSQERSGSTGRGSYAQCRRATVLLLAVLAAACRSGTSEAPPPATHVRAPLDATQGSWESELPADIVLVIDQSGSMSKGKQPTDPRGVRLSGGLSFVELVAGRSMRGEANRIGLVNFGTDAPRKQAAPLVPVAAVDDPNVKRLAAQLTPLDLGDTSFSRAIRCWLAGFLLAIRRYEFGLAPARASTY